MMGVVYFVQAGEGGPIKIGTTTDLDHRLQQLRTGSPAPLTLLGTISGDRQQERMMHSRFDSLRMEGEWFRPGEELMTFIRDHAGPDPRRPVTFMTLKLPHTAPHEVSRPEVVLAFLTMAVMIPFTSLFLYLGVTGYGAALCIAVPFLVLVLLQIPVLVRAWGKSESPSARRG